MYKVKSLKALFGWIQNSTVCKNYRPRRLSFSLSIANGALGSLSEGLWRGGRRERVCLVPGELCTVSQHAVYLGSGCSCRLPWVGMVQNWGRGLLPLVEGLRLVGSSLPASTDSIALCVSSLASSSTQPSHRHRKKHFQGMIFCISVHVHVCAGVCVCVCTRVCATHVEARGSLCLFLRQHPLYLKERVSY